MKGADEYKVIMLVVVIALSFLIAVGHIASQIKLAEDDLQDFCKTKKGYYYKAYKSTSLCLSPNSLILKEK